MAWRLARSLSTLRDQINALSPNRSKLSDGTIGDTAHSARKSDHNPDGSGIVRALDLTHDPAHGVSGREIAEALLKSRDQRLSYVISNGQIAAGFGGPSPWVWRKYSGSNPHNHHVHISVIAGSKGDDPKPWTLDLAVSSDVATKPVTQPVNPVLAKGTKGPDVERMQKLLIAAGAKIIADSDFGPKTEAALRAFQKAHRLVQDAVCGPYTWAALAQYAA